MGTVLLLHAQCRNLFCCYDMYTKQKNRPRASVPVLPCFLILLAQYEIVY